MKNKELTLGRAARWLRAAAAWAMAGVVVALAACQTAPLPPPACLPEAVSPALAAASAPPAPLPRPTRPPRVGLALGGGASRGFAHIGVIQVLEENGIHPDLVVGTSAGSLVAALYASGKNGHELAALALAMDESSITDWSFPGRGMIRGEALARYIRDNTQSMSFEQAKLPLGIVATDLDSGDSMLFRRGDVGTAVRASSAVPSVFQPVRIGSREYVDGGLVSPVPVLYARHMGAELVIAVDISSPPEGSVPADTLDILMQTFSIMSKSINRYELRDADVVVRPALLGIASADFSSRKRAIEAGRQAMLLALPLLRSAIDSKTR